MKKDNFIWNTPKEWGYLKKWCGIIYINDKNHVIFKEMHDNDKMPKDCVCWATMNELAKYCVTHSDMKYLLDKTKEG